MAKPGICNGHMEKLGDFFFEKMANLGTCQENMAKLVKNLYKNMAGFRHLK